MAPPSTARDLNADAWSRGATHAERRNTRRPSLVDTSAPADRLDRRSPAGFLSRLAVLQGENSSAPVQLAQISERIEVPRGETLWEVGDVADHIVVVRSGVLRAEVQCGDARAVVAGFLARGGWAGLDALAASGLRTATVSAHEDTTILRVSTGALLDWAASHPAPLLRMVGEAAHQTARLQARLAAQGHRHAKARLAAALHELAEDFGVRDSRGIIVDLRVTHRDLSAMIAATRETVSVAIDGLRRDGIIRTEHRRVILIDEEALEALRRSG